MRDRGLTLKLQVARARARVAQAKRAVEIEQYALAVAMEELGLARGLYESAKSDLADEEQALNILLVKDEAERMRGITEIGVPDGLLGADLTREPLKPGYIRASDVCGCADFSTEATRVPRQGETVKAKPLRGKVGVEAPPTPFRAHIGDRFFDVSFETVYNLLVWAQETGLEEHARPGYVDAATDVQRILMGEKP